MLLSHLRRRNITPILLVLLALSSAAFASTPPSNKDANQNFLILEQAFQKSMASDYPLSTLPAIVKAALLSDPVKGCDLARRAVDFVIAKHYKFSQDFYLGTACEVARYDQNLRDQLLTLAIVDAKKELEDESRWVGEPLDPLHNSETMAIARKMLAYKAEGWNAVLLQEKNPAEAQAKLCALFSDPAASLGTGGCVMRTFAMIAAFDVAALAPELFLASAPYDKNTNEGDILEVAHVAAMEANKRLRNDNDDPAIKPLISFAVRNGYTDDMAINTYALYDIAGAWELLPKMKSHEREITANRLIVTMAWKDLDKALSIAETQSDEMKRRDYIDVVSRVWAYRRPATIEQALKNQDNELRRKWARDIAAEELARRKAGKPARDTLEKARDGREGYDEFFHFVDMPTKTKVLAEMMQNIRNFK